MSVKLIIRIHVCTGTFLSGLMSELQIKGGIEDNSKIIFLISQ